MMESKIGPGVEVQTPDQQESMEGFKRRVEESTGVKFDEITEGDEKDILGGHIFCKRGDTYVVGIGKPIQEEDGTEIYNEFKVVHLSERDASESKEKTGKPNIYTKEAKGKQTHRWAFVYLDGQAEAEAGNDIFAADQPFPGVGVHDCMLGGKEAKAYIWADWSKGGDASANGCGLVVLADDEKANARAKQEMEKAKMS